MADKLVVGSKQRQVPRLFETRWSARVTTLSSVIAKYRAIVLALRDIAFESCSSESRANALYYINLLESSPLLVALVVVAQYILSFSKPLCLALQKESTDIIEAYEKAKTCCSAIKAQRSDDKLESQELQPGANTEAMQEVPMIVQRYTTDEMCTCLSWTTVYLNFKSDSLILQIQSSQGTNYCQTK